VSEAHGRADTGSGSIARAPDDDPTLIGPIVLIYAKALRIAANIAKLPTPLRH
jgi:hypothetical protein